MLKVDEVTRPNNLNIAALLALLVFLFMHFSSTGVIRGGDEDGGSGIGGTGRMAVPTSESGFGGTGFKPFVGVNEVNELEIMHSPQEREQAIAELLDIDVPVSIPVATAPAERTITVVAETAITRDSSAIDIVEEIQRTLDINAVEFQRELRSEPSIAVEAVAGSESADIIEEVVPQELAAADVEEVVTPDAATEANEVNSEVTWDRLANYLNQQQPLERPQLAAADADDDDLSRLNRPERIQRPVLPPVQRIRPIQRASILPPRIKPLRL